MKATVASACLAMIAPPAGPMAVHEKQGLADMLYDYLEIRYPGVDLTRDVLYVSAQRQRLFHMRERRMIAEFMVSTSARGLGSERGSGRTPEGRHRISDRIGLGVPEGGVFRERVFTGEHAGSVAQGKDLVTSRILWLDGLEAGRNSGGDVDSRTRGIYIHGTPDVPGLGRPVSHGCIRMSDADVIGLFDAVQVGTLVVILDN